MTTRPLQLHGLLYKLSECKSCRRFLYTLVGPARSGIPSKSKQRFGQQRCAAGTLPGPHRAHSRCRAASGATQSAAAAPVTAHDPSPNPSVPASASSNGTGARAGAGALTFQEAVARLQQYWAAQGCAVWLPHNSEVGAGTMNPATFLRVLGPERWRVCYVEPSVRPDDSRYGENPNRLQQHTQFQVILKPDPGNPQDLYLGSLEALGIDTCAHDVRFVEDNWENPALGAWGLGWEVWMDGQEVTQYTYFQQAGGQALPVPAVEITYGLERILMALQGVTHFRDIRFTAGLTYGEMLLQNEYEMSCYNMDRADVASQRQLFTLFQQEADRLLDARLPIPAYGQLLRLSQAFNVLDARGAVGVTERATCFAAMRGLARRVAQLWLERREELGYPLGQAPALAAPPMPRLSAGEPAPAAADLVVEVGCEELPPADADAAVAQLRERVPALLARLRLSHGAIAVHSTPRRLAVSVAAVATSQPDVEESVRGPPAKVAFGADGAPSKALTGFCAKIGADPAGVEARADAKGVEYVWATRREPGRPAAEVLTEELGALVGGLVFGRSMRWNSEVTFSRPVRWLLALHGSRVLPFAFGPLRAGPSTRLLRSDMAAEAQLADAASYLPRLEAAGITLCAERRTSDIWAGAQAAAAAAGGAVPESARGELLSEVAALVEAPTVLAGSFDAAFLALPREVLVTVMRKHQRYFPVCDAEGALLPAFVTVANGPVDVPTVRAGSEAVLRARFEDAQFFHRADLATPLEAMHAAATAATAARLARADLASALVTEMTALAGVMGRHYALAEGQPPEVAQAIYESVLPRQAGDELPRSPAGILVAVADRLDSLVGLCAAGCMPTASADPFGLRRSAYGMLEALVANNVCLDLPAAVGAAADLQAVATPPEARAAVVEFVTRRLEQLLVDGGCCVEGVRAALAERGADPALAAATARELQLELDAGAEGRLPRVMAALARPTRIVRGKEADCAPAVDEALFDSPQEAQLWKALRGVRGNVDPGMSIAAWLQAVEPLVEPVDAFFHSVFVMCEDAAVRANRLALLCEVAALPRGVLDLAQLPGF
ncbi:hypothetical protein WJX81_005719 [Elliptochloris bilobata]|uniref:glycine--tRNA ligase n=1 Tax=Elliptochloris bilobata TaxID=381761 RepID=A0AAW1S0W5_9CHLO